MGAEVSALRDNPKSGCFRINLGPGSAVGEKAKKIGERESGERNTTAFSVVPRSCRGRLTLKVQFNIKSSVYVKRKEEELKQLL